MAVEVADDLPADDLPADDAFVSVMGCSLHARSGERVLTSTTTTWEGSDRGGVPRGWLRLRISLAMSPFDEPEFDEDASSLSQHIRIQCWPAPPTDPVRLKERYSDPQ